MKKTVLILTAVMLLVSLCCAAAADGMLAGGWAPAEDTAMTQERTELLQKALDGLVGVKYEGVAYLGSQVVAGRNHCILCKATAVAPDAVPKYVLVFIYEDLQGNATIMNFADFDFGALCEYGSAK